MKQIHHLDRMGSELNSQRLKVISAKKAKVQFDRWKNQERIINLIISCRAKCLEPGIKLIVEG